MEAIKYDNRKYKIIEKIRSTDKDLKSAVFYKGECENDAKDITLQIVKKVNIIEALQFALNTFDSEINSLTKIYIDFIFQVSGDGERIV